MLYLPSVMYMTVRYSCWWDCMCRFISPELGIGCTRLTPLLYGRVNNTFLLSGIMRCNVNRTWNTKIVVIIHSCVLVWRNQKHLMFYAIWTIRVRKAVGLPQDVWKCSCLTNLYPKHQNGVFHHFCLGSWPGFFRVNVWYTMGKMSPFTVTINSITKCLT